jgi:hypothetical protein
MRYGLARKIPGVVVGFQAQAHVYEFDLFCFNFLKGWMFYFFLMKKIHRQCIIDKPRFWSPL